MSYVEIDSVDAAFLKYKELLPSLKTWAETIQSEQDTRLKIIDPIFIQVLGWDPSTIHTEEPTGDGFVDYKFSINGLSRLIVEAKKDARNLGLEGRNPGRSYRLDGPILSKSPLPRDGILQAIRYCGSKNSELACVTNGNEWIIFRGSRLGDGKDTLSGMAFVFPSLDGIESKFTEFYDLLGRSRVDSFIFRAMFQEAEGQPIRAKAFSRTLKPIDGYRLLDKSNLSQDVDRLMSAFFKKISGDDDPGMLAECFVTTKESQIADEKLARITEDLSLRIKNLDTNDGDRLVKVIQRVKETNKNDFVLLVGTKGAGKSTFIERFFNIVIDRELRDGCVIIRVDVGKSSGEATTIVSWLNNKLLETIEKEIFGNIGPTYDEIQGMFFDEYQRQSRGPHKFLYDNDKIKFKQQFGEHIEKIRENDTKKYIERLIKNIVTSRKKTPCVIFDNTDHFSIEFQEAVFQYARSIYEGETCLVIIPITDKTSWQLSQQGALQSFDNEALFLPTPLPKTIFERRIHYIQNKLTDEHKEKKAGYFLSKGIHLSFDNLNAFVASLQEIFVATGVVSHWIGQLSNNDIRRCLNLSRDIVSSPYLGVDALVSAFLTNTSASVSEFNIKRSIIRRGYNIYPTGGNPFVQNIYALNTEIESTPLLSLRLLRLLRDAKSHNAGGFDDYLTIDQIVDYIQALGLDRRATLMCLDAMVKTGLCYSYDPTITNIEKAKKIQLSPSGLQHLHWGSWDETYIGSMVQVTPIGDEATYEQLKSYEQVTNKRIRWTNELIVFIRYLLKEDNLYAINIDHQSYEGQRKLRKSLQKKLRTLEESILHLDKVVKCDDSDL